LIVILAVKGLHQVREMALAAALTALTVLVLGVPWRPFLTRSLWVFPFCVAALPLLLTVPGPTLAQLPGGWTISAQGVERFLAVAAQCLLCLQIILIASSVSGPFALVEGMGRLGCPARLVAVLRLCLRYMELLTEELSRLQRARQSRGGRAEPSLAFRARVTGQLVGTLFLRSLDRAERVEVAMRSRGAGAFRMAASPSAWGATETLVVGLAIVVAGISWTW
jgi:cobalt/nickel transport system permease protein